MAKDNALKIDVVPASFLEAQTKADDCTIALTKALAQFQAARACWIEAKLAYELELALLEPAWPEFPNWPPQGCPHCPTKMVVPILHPQTEQDGVRCTECGKRWLVPKHYVPKKNPQVAIFNYRQALKVLVGELDYDLDMAKYLVDTGGAARLLRLAQAMPAISPKHHAQVALIGDLFPSTVAPPAPAVEKPALGCTCAPDPIGAGHSLACPLGPKKTDNHPF